MKNIDDDKLTQWLSNGQAREKQTEVQKKKIILVNIYDAVWYLKI